ncbi:uncharacterized protein V1513DRAFT_445559 [Lipomyces chichibuensis]|uniref:uncharacterized protein n=1 Tax=Lipomyces chichibuensis TaxID=1546026 RepID=UPI003343F276
MRRFLKSLSNLRQARQIARSAQRSVGRTNAEANTPIRRSAIDRLALRSIYSWRASPQAQHALSARRNALTRNMGVNANVVSRTVISPHHQVSFDNKKVYIPWDEGVTSSYHNVWLRDSCQCASCFHPITKQRLVDTFTIPTSVHPESAEALDAALKITWQNDGHESFYPWDWLHLHSYQPVLEKDLSFRKVLWSCDEVQNNPPVVEFSSVMSSDAGVAEWTSKIKLYGFCFVDGVPVNPDDTEKLINRISFPRQTHYGGFWDFTSDLAANDTAYTDLALGLHTDGTYFTEPPGLQILHLLHHNGSGGESVLADGFKAARILREEAPEHYKTLSRIRIPAHSAGNEDVCIRPASASPILNHDEATGELIQVRWNNDDRSTMDRWEGGDPDVEVIRFYEAIRKWHEIVTRRETEYWFKLRPGRALIFDNWRVMHGRSTFDGERRLCGAYISMDDFESRMRLTNLGREAVLKYI